MTFSFIAVCYVRDLLSFPTRRSSDLREVRLPPRGLSDRALPPRGRLRRRDPDGVGGARLEFLRGPGRDRRQFFQARRARQDRKSTRLNSSHLVISYAVFCLKKIN